MPRPYLLPPNDLRSSSEIALGSLAELAAKHGDEGAGTGVAGVEGGSGDFFSGGQELHGVKQAQLLAPLVEGHFGLREEEALDGAFTGAGFFAESFERAVFRGIGEEESGDAEGAGIVWVRQLQGDGVGGLELVDDDFNDAAVERALLLQFGEFAGVEDQFAEECGDVHDETLRWKKADEAGSEVQSAHGKGRCDADGVRRFRGNPDGAERRDDPDAVFGLHRHDAVGSEDELIFGVRMLNDVVRAGEVVRQGGDVSGAAAAAVEEEAVTLLRHLLST